VEHLQAVKRIIRYVSGTLDFGLHYSRCPGAAHFIGYSDSDHPGDIDTSKSTSEMLFFLSKCCQLAVGQATGGGFVQL